MTAGRWSETERLFHEALEQPPAAREDFLRRNCADEDLRAEVASLLASHESPAIVDAPALGAGFELPPLMQAIADPLLGRTIGPFRIEERVASGGMATVYRAVRAHEFEQTVAVKVIHPWRDPEVVLKRFQVERQTLAQLSHPNIARLFDAGITDDGLLYLVMEFIDGEPIDTFCDRRRLPVAARLRLFEEVVRTVHFAHQNLVVHRDLKPGNVLVTAGGAPKLLDFGIAKVLDAADAAPQEGPATLTMAMTPEYASPEQVLGEPVTTATDVYSLGVILYGLLCGGRAHRLRTLRMEEIERVVCREMPRRPSTLLLDPARADGAAGTLAEVAAARSTTPHRLQKLLRGDLDNITLSCLRKDPQRRYASAQQLAEDLERHRTGRPVAARGDSVWYRTAKFARRNRLAVGAAFLLLAALAGGAATTAWQARIAADERDAARHAETVAAAEARAARAAEQAARAEAEHATIESRSASQLAEFLTDAFLLSAPHETRADVARSAALLDLQVERVERQFADEPHLAANLLDALGRVYVSLGLHDRARDVITKAAAVRAAEFGTDSLEHALSLGSQAQLALAEGRYEDAVRDLRTALDLHRGLPGDVHSDPARAANDLAVALRNVGSSEEAEALHGEALALRRAEHGERHPLVAESLNNLAAVRVQRGEFGRAIAELRQSLAIRTETLGERHPLTTQSLGNLAKVLELTGDFAAAEPLYRRALEQSRGPAGADPDSLALMLLNHAEVLRELGRPAAAQQALDESLAIRRAHFGDDSLQVATALVGLARLGSGRSADELGRLWQEALEIQRRRLPERHASLATTLTGYGHFLVERGDPAAGEPLLREAVEIYRQGLPPGHLFTAVAEVNLGRCLGRLGRYEEGEALLLAAREVLARERGAESPDVRSAEGCLVELYRAWGRPERAALLGR